MMNVCLRFEIEIQFLCHECTPMVYANVEGRRQMSKIR